MNRALQKANQEERGITGLETTIVLIAFVMVASIFAYVVLSAGIFSSQKAKQAIRSGLEETESTLVVKGNVVARVEDQKVTHIYFTVGIVPGAGPIDFTDTSEGKNVVVISYRDSNEYIPKTTWTMEKINKHNEDNLLDEDELFQITVDLTASEVQDLGPYDTFTLEVKPPTGAVLTIERTIPARVSEFVNLG